MGVFHLLKNTVDKSAATFAKSALRPAQDKLFADWNLTGEGRFCSRCREFICRLK
jgi:hypothetical protein